MLRTRQFLFGLFACGLGAASTLSFANTAYIALGEGSGAGRETLPLGKLCDGTPESFYDEALFEPANCGSGEAQIPTARHEAPPRFSSPFLDERCNKSLAFQSRSERFECTEIEFWLGFQDGRYLQREHSINYLSSAITLSEWVFFKSNEFKKKLARLYELRAIGKIGMGLENGRLDYLIFGGLHSGADFGRVEQLDPGNIPAESFDLSIELTNARLSGDHELATQKAWEILDLAKTAGDPEVLEPLNVGMILTVMGMLSDFPISTGLPEATLDALLWARELPGLTYDGANTDKAPFVRPGLEYALASLYARAGKRDEYIAQLEVVAEQDNYENWAWYDFVEEQRKNPNRLLEKFASFGDDKYADSYAGSNNGCVFCHGGI